METEKKREKKPCNCVRECPCFPKCDEMMEQNMMTQMWGNPSQAQPSRMGWNAPQSQPQPPMTGWNGVQPQPLMHGWNGAQPQPPVMGWNGVQPQPSVQGWNGRAWMETQMQPNPEEEDEKDWEKLKEQYPETAKWILSSVEEACDKMEYEGSVMFDALPDKTRVKNVAEEIQQMLEEKMAEEQAEEVTDLYTMEQAPCRNCRRNPNIFGDFIETMLYHEMHQRRCRHRRCRRW